MTEAHPPRPEMIDALAQRALDVMRELDPTVTASEVVWASLTVARRAVRAARQLDGAVAPLRAAIYCLLAETADPMPQ